MLITTGFVPINGGELVALAGACLDGPVSAGLQAAADPAFSRRDCDGPVGGGTAGTVAGAPGPPTPAPGGHRRPCGAQRRGGDGGERDTGEGGQLSAGSCVAVTQSQSATEGVRDSIYFFFFP